ncbi:hypothetical protein K435DRAFT_797115 [Dendrothele bispora CBS 962.96]|uniref:Uncharacterized protein n=1 Tax=Dendrothele bispora (strain CBS 962.96) TaxID=1314807 RepID=A0A4S8M3H5_DENBC|nr:hypothetical protein K435DRAFT_797115 [Dendrothele bispora CBS 962.96]
MTTRLEPSSPLPTLRTDWIVQGAVELNERTSRAGSFVLSTLRTTFSLDIPSDASAAFQIKARIEKATGHGYRVFKASIWFTVLKTQRQAYPTHKTSNTTGTTASTPGFLSFSSTSLYPHAPYSGNSYSSCFGASSCFYTPSFSAFVPSFSFLVILITQYVVVTTDIDTVPYPTQQSITGGLERKVRPRSFGPFPSEQYGLGPEERCKWESLWKAVGGYWVVKKSGSGLAETNQEGPVEVELMSEQEHGLTAMVKGMVKSRALRILGFFDLKGLEVKLKVKVRTKARTMGICEDGEAEMNGCVDILRCYDGINLTRSGAKRKHEFRGSWKENYRWSENKDKGRWEKEKE